MGTKARKKKKRTLISLSLQVPYSVVPYEIKHRAHFQPQKNNPPSTAIPISHRQLLNLLLLYL